MGNAALAMWWSMAPEQRTEFEDWHSHEHYAERLAIPGFLRASRWMTADGGEGVFVLYELDDLAALSSDAYRATQKSPTPRSLRMVPHLQGITRRQCTVACSFGGLAARHALTLRMSERAGARSRLLDRMAPRLKELARRPGLTGAHLLAREASARQANAAQALREAAERDAEWVLVVCGYDAQALRAVAAAELSPDALMHAGAAAVEDGGLYVLSHSAVAGDLA